MKKIVFMAVIVMIICVSAVSAYADFGELSWKTGEGFLILSQGGSDTPDSFGFAVSDGYRTIHLYNIGGSFDKPYAAKLNGLSSSETEIRQFMVTDGVFYYGEPIYIVGGNNVRTLLEIKSELCSEFEAYVNPELYREWERNEIERIVADTKTKILESDRRYAADAAVKSAKEELSELKTDEQLKAEELIAAKESAIAEIGSFLDKILYRDAEVAEIDLIITEGTELINSAEDISEIASNVTAIKNKLSLILTSEQLKVNAELNAEVITYLEKAISELEATRFIGNEKKIINIVVPVMKEVVSDGKYGRIVITPEYVKGTYVTQVQNVKELYDKMDPEFEKPAFEQKLAQLDMETQAFLKEYFL